MKFKEQMSKDIQTFMCRDGSLNRILDGRSLDDHRSFHPRWPTPSICRVSLHQIIVHVAEDELGYIPAQGQRSDLDGISVSVEKVSVDAGMLKIILEANVA
ncbi:hypothetical protein P7H22_26230 [Paenibacillus larvae]|nr:hypothetical protein [Paenibacillus larvae]MDT2243128.1 hypothetical protein [Paenibacillus larvae]